MNSIQAVAEFISQNNLPVDSYGNCEFQGYIGYKSNIKNIFEKTTVRFVRNGYNDGDIHLTESGELTSDNFHLDFSRNYQKYKYDISNQLLIISGDSEKMGGSYQITIELRV